MSFDLFLHTCNLGTKLVKNPFNGDLMPAIDDSGLSIDERVGVAKLFKGLNAEGPDQFGYYSLSFPDGGEADLSAEELASDGKMVDCLVQTRSLTRDLVAFLLQMSQIGNMVILAVAEGVNPLVTSEEQRRQVADRFPDAKVVRSVAALEEELRRGFQSWNQYRDQILEE
jgi:hypothetical protein